MRIEPLPDQRPGSSPSGSARVSPTGSSKPSGSPAANAILEIFARMMHLRRLRRFRRYSSGAHAGNTVAATQRPFIDAINIRKGLRG
jgi:hypothetical protein